MNNKINNLKYKLSRAKIANNAFAFTLVELIVVITILAILSTTWFVSFQWYTSSARDSVRISDLTNIQKWLELYQVKVWKYPVPDNNKITLLASWTIIWYQWYLWSNVQKNINLWWDIKDTLDKIYYTYSTNDTFSKYQILWFFEGSQNITTNFKNISITEKAYASDFSERFPVVKWERLWILLSSWTNFPIQELYNEASFTWLDVVNTSDIYKAIRTNKSNGILIWSWIILKDLDPKYLGSVNIKSCIF